MNKLIGELEIELGGKKYLLKPTHEALTKIEDLSGKSLGKLFTLFTKIEAGLIELNFKDTVAIIYGGMYGKNGNKELMSVSEIGEHVMSDGLINFISVGFIIAAVYTGKPIDEFVAKREVDKDPNKVVVTEEKKT